jgi:hypothetical protein
MVFGGSGIENCGVGKIVISFFKELPGVAVEEFGGHSKLQYIIEELRRKIQVQMERREWMTQA